MMGDGEWGEWGAGAGPIFSFWPFGSNCQDQQKIFANFIL